jgi:3-deoxy-D-manno-octulosonic-acid transferase
MLSSPQTWILRSSSSSFRATPKDLTKWRRRSLPAAWRSRGRSDNSPVPPQTRVVLGDSLGEMLAYYAAADVVIMGGSFLPFGSQNLIEACAVGRP